MPNPAPPTRRPRQHRDGRTALNPKARRPPHPQQDSPEWWAVEPSVNDPTADLCGVEGPSRQAIKFGAPLKAPLEAPFDYRPKRHVWPI